MSTTKRYYTASQLLDIAEVEYGTGCGYRDNLQQALRQIAEDYIADHYEAGNSREAAKAILVEMIDEL